MFVALGDVSKAHRLFKALPLLCRNFQCNSSTCIADLACSVLIQKMHSLSVRCSCSTGLLATTRHCHADFSSSQALPRLHTGLPHALGHTKKHRNSHQHFCTSTSDAPSSESMLSVPAAAAPEQASSTVQQASTSSISLPPSAFRRRRHTSTLRAALAPTQQTPQSTSSAVEERPQQQQSHHPAGTNGTAATSNSRSTAYHQSHTAAWPVTHISPQLRRENNPPSQHMQHNRSTSSSLANSIRRGTTGQLQPSAGSSSSRGSGLDAAGSNGYTGVGSILSSDHHQNQQQQMVRAPADSRPETSSSLDIPSHSQQQQQQHWLHHTDFQLHHQQQQPAIPPGLLQRPPSGPLLIDISAMLSWSDGSPPGHDSWAAKHLPADLHLDQRRLLWVSVYQPGGPGSSAAIWVGKTFLKTSDAARSDQMSSQAGSGQHDLEHAGSGQDHDDLHLLELQEGIVLREDLIRSLTPIGSQPQQQQQQQQQDGLESAMQEHEGQQQGRRRRRIKLERQPKQRKQRRMVAPGQHWLHVQQRPDLGAGPAAVVEGLTFPCSSSSSSSGGDINPESESQQQQEAAMATSANHDLSWFDYLLLVAGDFSVREHENMFPNCLVHCSDGRVMFDARGPHDIASFVAEAHEPELRSHMINLIRIAWDKKDDVKYGPHWVLHRLRQRWGAAAMERFGVDMDYLNARVVESGVMRVTGNQQSSAADQQ